MFFSEQKNQFKSFTRRSLLLLFAKLSLFSFVGWRLFDIQITNSNKYKTLSNNNRIDVKVIFPTRGLILDRNNKVIVDNFKTYSLFIVPEEIDNIELLLINLSNIVNIPFKQRKKAIQLSKKIKKFEMIKILDNLNWAQLEKIEANKINLPGVHLFASNKRNYSYNNFFSHVVGYTSKPSKEDLSLPFISSMPSLEIGKTGIEKQFNEELIGIPGNREVEVNAVGREIREIAKTSSIEGQKILLSLDVNIQKFIHEKLLENRSGSIVVMNVNSGEVLGMLSLPDFNPNKLINKPNEEYWKNILENELAPLNNRAIQGLYAPGSTFKMIVALAALEKQVIDKNFNVYCEGKIEFGDRLYHCWKKEGHGKVNLLKGIKESCDCYFYELARLVGINDISKMAYKFGLGQKTKIELPSESSGIVPNNKWKKEKLKESWYAGETLITGIGQGYILTTPLQLATMTSIIANGGKLIQPTLIKEYYNNVNIKDLKKYKRININDSNLELIKDAMKKVVNEPNGTAFKIKNNSDKYILAGKTGTSQVKRITLTERESEDFRKKFVEWKNRDHGLFVGYMPANKPKFAVCVVVEHGGSGSKSAAPIAKEIFNKLYQLNI